MFATSKDIALLSSAKPVNSSVASEARRSRASQTESTSQTLAIFWLAILMEIASTSHATVAMAFCNRNLNVHMSRWVHFSLISGNPYGLMIFQTTMTLPHIHHPKGFTLLRVEDHKRGLHRHIGQEQSPCPRAQHTLHSVITNHR